MTWDNNQVKIELAYHRKFFRALWAVWLAGVVWGSLISQREMASLDNVLPFLAWNDKLLHYGAYAGLAFFAILGFAGRRGVVVALSMILLGALLEVAQRFSPGRTPDIVDALANSFGVLTGMALGILLPHGLARPRPAEAPTQPPVR